MFLDGQSGVSAKDGVKSCNATLLKVRQYSPLTIRLTDGPVDPSAAAIIVVDLSLRGGGTWAADLSVRQEMGSR